jgi:hypothetical protein
MPDRPWVTCWRDPSRLRLPRKNASSRQTSATTMKKNARPGSAHYPVVGAPLWLRRCPAPRQAGDGTATLPLRAKPTQLPWLRLLSCHVHQCRCIFEHRHHIAIMPILLLCRYAHSDKAVHYAPQEGDRDGWHVGHDLPRHKEKRIFLYIIYQNSQSDAQDSRYQLR